MKAKYPVGAKYCFMEVEPQFSEYVHNEAGVSGLVYSYKGLIHVNHDQCCALNGDELDRLIATLRRAKSAWLRGYRKEQKKVSKKGNKTP